MFAFDNTRLFGLQGRIRNDGYLPFTSASYYPGGASATFAPVTGPAGHPIFFGVQSFVGALAGHRHGATMAPGALRIANWSDDGQVFAATRDTGFGRIAGFNFYPVSQATEATQGYGGEGAKLLANALVWSSRRAESGSDDERDWFRA